MLARLERRLGVALFDRRGKRLTLNAYGRIFYEHARRAQLELDSARRAIDDLTNPAVGEIRLGFLRSFGSTVVPRLIADFTQASPRVTFALSEGAADSIGDLVESGSIDVGVVSPRPRKPTLAWRSLFRQRLGVAVPRGHRLTGVAAVSMTDLVDEPFVAMHAGFGMRRLLDELCAAAQFQPRIALESANLTTTAGLVAAGLGISLMPIDGTEHAPGVTTLPLADADAYRDVGVIWSSAKPLSRPARNFVASAASIQQRASG
jgi:LysR family transcriptional regulator, transcription activator of glutamate synthase operon